MKIFNICIGCYTEGWGYQENVLPEYENKAGYDTIVFSSRNHYPAYLEDTEKRTIIERGCHYSFNGVRIYRYNTYIHTTGLVFISTHLLRTLLKEKPEIVFHHGTHMSLLKCALYKLFHRKTVIFVDSHVDYINQSPNRLWNYITRKCLLRVVCKITSPFIEKFYGVSPGRCDYLKEVYHIKASKVSLLPIGGDVDLVNKIDDTGFRTENKIDDSSFILCMGGKLDKTKGAPILIRAYQRLRTNCSNLLLVLFGKITDDETEDLVNKDSSIINVGWCNREKTIMILKQAQIAIWPIHHTTLIEDAVSCATPVITRNTGNTSHLVTNNGVLLKEGSEEELLVSIEKIYNNYAVYKQNAEALKERFSYPTIVNQILQDYQTAINR